MKAVVEWTSCPLGLVYLIHRDAPSGWRPDTYQATFPCYYEQLVDDGPPIEATDTVSWPIHTTIVDIEFDSPTRSVIIPLRAMGAVRDQLPDPMVEITVLSVNFDLLSEPDWRIIP